MSPPGESKSSHSGPGMPTLKSDTPPPCKLGSCSGGVGEGYNVASCDVSAAAHNTSRTIAPSCIFYANTDTQSTDALAGTTPVVQAAQGHHYSQSMLSFLIIILIIVVIIVNTKLNSTFVSIEYSSVLPFTGYRGAVEYSFSDNSELCIWKCRLSPKIVEFKFFCEIGINFADVYTMNSYYYKHKITEQ